jgi:hypothetical protein
MPPRCTRDPDPDVFFGAIVLVVQAVVCFGLGVAVGLLL